MRSRVTAGVRALAEQLGMTDLAEELPRATLDEEKKTNEKLSQLGAGATLTKKPWRLPGAGGRLHRVVLARKGTTGPGQVIEIISTNWPSSGGGSLLPATHRRNRFPPLDEDRSTHTGGPAALINSHRGARMNSALGGARQSA